MTNDDGRRERRRDDEEAIGLALFRYGVIGPLVEQEEYAPGEVTKLVREVAERMHYLPGTGPVRVSERTVYAWLRRYRDGGVEALRPKVRKDRGRARVVDEETVERAVRLRKEVPARWTSTLLDILVREGTLSGEKVPHRSTLDRHLARKGASRRQMKVLGEKRTIKMHFDEFGDLWVGDYKHGPVVLEGDGRLVTSKLGAFLDHATRYPVAYRFYGSETLATLRDTLLRAFLTWGPAKVVYIDGGSAYKAEQLGYSLARLEIKLVRSKPYYSQGRGLIERWWQEVDAFIAEVQAREGDTYTLHELNRAWQAWCELRYCNEVHSELGKTPNEAVASVEKKPIDVEVARELFLCRASRKVDKRDACVSVEGRRFLCESWLRRKRVDVRYAPNDLTSVVVFYEGKRVQRAFPQPLNAPPEPQPEPEVVRQSVDYLALLREDFDRRLLEHAQPLAYADLEDDPSFGPKRFVEVVADLAGLGPTPSERRELEGFWNLYGPLPEPLVRIATEHAVRLHTRGRHVRVYLHAVRTLALARLRNPNERNKP